MSQVTTNIGSSSIARDALDTQEVSTTLKLVVDNTKTGNEADLVKTRIIDILSSIGLAELTYKSENSYNVHLLPFTEKFGVWQKFFVQKRKGQGGKDIWVSKFETMEPGSDKSIPQDLIEQGKETFTGVDPRITEEMDKFRKSARDEYANVLSILRGDMNLYGARPLTGEDLEQTSENFQKLYKQFKPGVYGGKGIDENGDPYHTQWHQHKYLRARSLAERQKIHGWANLTGVNGLKNIFDIKGIFAVYDLHRKARKWGNESIASGEHK